MNLPNSITMSRICCIPLLIWMLSNYFPFRSFHGEQEMLRLLLFILASITDGVDGYLARRRGQITTMGMLLDPIGRQTDDHGSQYVSAWCSSILIS